MESRQLDILATRPDWFTLPKYLPGRMNADDYIFFKWPSNVNPQKYKVVVEVSDTAGQTFRSIGHLQDSLELPHVQYGWHPLVGVVPDSKSLPIFRAELIRGSTYIIPDTKGINGAYQMERHGMHRPPGI